MTDYPWLSIHLFYHDDPVPLLLECIKPLIAELRAQQAIERFFFIRYWQGGPHIRLRLLCTRASLRESIQHMLEARVATFFTNHPSLTQIEHETYARYRAALGRREYAQEDQTPLYPNNSFQYIPYEPEYERYGGVEAMPVVEGYFMQSSEIVFDLLQKGPSHDRLTGQAIAMMFLGIWLWENDLTNLPMIFERYSRGWMATFNVDRAYTPPLFEKKYSRQSQQLRHLVEQLLALKQQQDFSLADSLMARWFAALKTLKEQLCLLESQGRLQYRPGTGSPEHPEQLKYHSLQGILFSCLHMHNNRLGISLLEEAYLAFLLQQTLTEMIAERSSL